MTNSKKRVVAFLMAAVGFCIGAPAVQSFMSAAQAQSILPLGGTAQGDYLPATEITETWLFPDIGTRQAWIAMLDSYPEFVAEMELRDNAGLFAATVAGQARPDVFVGIFENFDVAVLHYREIGLGGLADNIIASQPEPDTFVNSVVSTSPEGHRMHIFTFVRDVASGRSDDRCLARFLIDVAYRGNDAVTIPVTACSLSLAAEQ